MENIDQNQLKKIPGSYGPPLIGLVKQGLTFKKDWRAFFNHLRDKYNSNVFRSAAGIKAITILDQKGIEVLFSTENISKLYGFGPLKPPPARIGGIIPTVFSNEEEHDRQKDFFMTLLRMRGRDMLTDFERISTPYFKNWVGQQGQFDWGLQLNAFLSDFIFGWVVGAQPEPEDVMEWAFNVLPREVVRFPGKGNKPIVKKMERLLEVIQSGKHFDAALKMATEKANLSRDHAAKQLLFYLGFNAWAAIHGLTRSLIAELTLNPSWQDQAVSEIKAVFEDQPEITLDRLTQLTILPAIIKETLRLHMPAPFAFGKARKDFVIPSSSGNFLVCKGEIVNGAISHAHRDPDIFESPDIFDPSRFINTDNDQYLIWAHGRDIYSPSAESRMCPGRDVVYLLMQLFLLKLLSGYQWELRDKPKWNEKEFQSANRPDMDFICSRFEPRIP